MQTQYQPSTPLRSPTNSAGFPVSTGARQTNIWQAIRELPGVRDFRLLRDFAFLLTSFPMGVAAFLVILVGGITGASLSIVLIGFPILVWSIGLSLRMAGEERNRMRVLLDVEIDAPRYPVNSHENTFLHLLNVVQSPRVRRDLAYMLLLLPIGMLELIVALLPFEFLISSLIKLVAGSSLTVDVLGFEIASRGEALLFVGFGGLLLLPMLILMSVVTQVHANLATRMLGR